MNKKYWFFFGMTFLLLQSCYYDSVQELYPIPAECDTTNVTYTNSIWPVISSNCTSCHSGPAPSGNMKLSNYNEIVIQAQNGNLLGVIRHDAGFPQMPKDGQKLNSCDITHIEIWINDGTPDN